MMVSENTFFFLIKLNQLCHKSKFADLGGRKKGFKFSFRIFPIIGHDSREYSRRDMSSDSSQDETCHF